MTNFLIVDCLSSAIFILSQKYDYLRKLVKCDDFQIFQIFKFLPPTTIFPPPFLARQRQRRKKEKEKLKIRQKFNTIPQNQPRLLKHHHPHNFPQHKSITSEQKSTARNRRSSLRCCSGRG